MLGGWDAGLQGLYTFSVPVSDKGFKIVSQFQNAPFRPISAFGNPAVGGTILEIPTLFGAVEISAPLPLRVREPNSRRSRRRVAGKRFESGACELNFVGAPSREKPRYHPRA